MLWMVSSVKKKASVSILSVAGATEHSGEMGKELMLDEDNQSKSSLELELLLEQINKWYLSIYSTGIMKESTKKIYVYVFIYLHLFVYTHTHLFI